MRFGTAMPLWLITSLSINYILVAIYHLKLFRAQIVKFTLEPKISHTSGVFLVRLFS